MTIPGNHNRFNSIKCYLYSAFNDGRRHKVTLKKLSAHNQCTLPLTVALREALYVARMWHGGRGCSP